MQRMCCCKLMFFFRDCSVEDCFFANYYRQRFYGDCAVADIRLCRKFAVAVFLGMSSYGLIFLKEIAVVDCFLQDSNWC